LDELGNLKLTDFGLSKMTMDSSQKAKSMCGTPEYLAPEIVIDNSGHDKTVDWWSFGAVLYEMFHGAPPFYSADKKEMFKNILTKPI